MVNLFFRTDSKFVFLNQTKQSNLDSHDLDYVQAYAILVGIFYFLSIFRTLNIFSALLSVSATIHKKLVHAIAHSPMRFFETNSGGLLLRLFSNDIGIADEILPIFLFVGIMVSILIPPPLNICLQGAKYAFSLYVSPESACAGTTRP